MGLEVGNELEGLLKADRVRRNRHCPSADDQWSSLRL